MNNWLRKLKKKAILPAAAFLVAAAAIGTTFAWQKWDLDITNNLKAHETKVFIDEPNFEGGEDKEVTIKNVGDSSVFLRVTYSEYWIKGETVPSVDVLPDDKKHHVEPIWSNTTILPNGYAELVWNNPSWQEDWVDGGDGWYYYKKVLTKKGTDEYDHVKILKRVILDPERPDDYKAANYRLFFKAEVVQCSDGSNTLNSEAVNADASYKLFGKSAVVQTDGRSVKWYDGELTNLPAIDKPEIVKTWTGGEGEG